MNPINIRLAGVTFQDAQKNIKRFGKSGHAPYELVREPGNINDPNAVRVEFSGNFIGYLPRMEAAVIAPLMDQGRRFFAQFLMLNRHPTHSTVGITVQVVEIAQ